MKTTGKSYVLAGNKSFCNFCPGYCCYRLPGSSLLLTGDDINRIARYFAISDGEVRRRYIEHRNTFRTRVDGSCIFLAQGQLCKRCSIHEARPRQCREFPYDRPCPYLENEGLLQLIQPRIEQSLFASPDRAVTAF
nr:YkgJ family cysteine cluster protein [uncultured Desulfobulbus sp.]